MAEPLLALLWFPFSLLFSLHNIEEIVFISWSELLLWTTFRAVYQFNSMNSIWILLVLIRIVHSGNCCHFIGEETIVASKQFQNLITVTTHRGRTWFTYSPKPSWVYFVLFSFFSHVVVRKNYSYAHIGLFKCVCIQMYSLSLELTAFPSYVLVTPDQPQVTLILSSIHWL